MTIKTIKRKAPVVIQFPDYEGTLHDISLPGELSIVARLKIEELNGMDETTEFTEDDLFEVFNVILGESNADKLIHQLRASESELQEVLAAYIQELGERQEKKEVTQNQLKKQNKRLR